MEQGSQEWHDIRCGRITASRISDIMAKLKSGKPSASRKSYISELVAERLSGQPADFYMNSYMQWGIDTEPKAREAYERENLVEVKEIGFKVHPDIENAGCSPDGVIDPGLIEIKCPKTSTHLDTVLSGKIPKKYILQMQWQMCCMDAEWCDFVSYDPRLPSPHDIWIKRISRDDELIKQIESEVIEADKEVDNIIEKLNQ